MKCTCPICNGKGCIEAPKTGHKGSSDKIIQVKKLKAKGYSIRKIASLMGYTSPSPIHRWLNKK
jgi:transposase